MRALGPSDMQDFVAGKRRLSVNETNQVVQQQYILVSVNKVRPGPGHVHRSWLHGLHATFGYRLCLYHMELDVDGDKSHCLDESTQKACLPA
jgi:hypothetical protein